MKMQMKNHRTVNVIAWNINKQNIGLENTKHLYCLFWICSILFVIKFISQTSRCWNSHLLLVKKNIHEIFRLPCPWNSKAQQTIVLILNTNGQKNIHKKVTRLNFHNILPPKNDRDKQMHDYEKQKEICEGESVEENQKKNSICCHFW